jgi:glycerophosphoryl diester phosphodiesterase
MKHPLLDPNARLVIAHRGNRVRSAENTIEALSEAVELGADALEFDVRATSDGIAVLMHDPDLDRTTDGHGLLGSYTLSDLRTLNAAARAPGRAGTASRVLIPSLEEVLDRFREIPLVVEVKERAAVAPTELLVRKFGAQNRIVIGSADAEVVRRFHRTGLPTCASVVEAARLIPMALAGITPAKPSYDVLSITPRFHGSPIPVLRMTAVAKRAGIATQVWTVNDPRYARSLWLGGVAGIVTDDPAALLRAKPA